MNNTKKIVGLDVGTNSIGWAIIENNTTEKTGKILGIGSRILPMDQKEISDFNSGNLQSATSSRTLYRAVRRLRNRQLNRRKRLVKVLKTIGFISEKWEPNSNYSLAFTFDESIGKTRFKFQKSYEEMSSIFKEKHPSLNCVSHDWAIYYLRTKALKEKISGEELAWIILQFNAKRGYFQLRDDGSLKTDSNKYFTNSIVDEIVDLNDDVRGRKSLQITLRNGIIGYYSDKQIPNWIGKSIDFIVTTKTVKEEEKVIFSAPDENDWTLRKKKTEQIIDNSNKTLGQHIFSKIVDNPFIKIRGNEVHTIDRKYYKRELEQIIQKQMQFHDVLKDSLVFKSCVDLLYKRNISHKTNLQKYDLKHLIIEDILYYQRPLKSKKHLISNCKFESYKYKNKKNEIVEKPIKSLPKSHPMYQEFRIWEYIHNLKVYKLEERDSEGILRSEVDKTEEILPWKMKATLFDLFDIKKELSHTQILKALKCNPSDFKLNYEEGTKLKGNELKYAISKCLSKINTSEEISELLNDYNKVEIIWHSIYSLGDNSNYLKAALRHERLNLTEQQIQAIATIPSFSKDYGAFSKKALNKILPLMRVEKYWSVTQIDHRTRSRIENILNAEESNAINERSREILSHLTSLNDFQGLNLTKASYAIYGRHSESVTNRIYRTPEEVDVNILLPNHSLRNPTAEKIIRESLLITRDIWKKFGKIDEIHVEMARELKLPNKKRRDYINQRNENYRSNQRAKAMLLELSNTNSSINPFSKGHLETFKIFEEGAIRNESIIEKDILSIRKKDDPTRSEITKYKLWLEQKYISPYTGNIIPLSRLFTPDYEIEHIIPKSLFYDDSFNNKIICEASVNKYKENRTAYELICNDGSKEISSGIILLNKEEYENHVKTMFASINYRKYKNLLSYDPPKSFSARQLSNTRYINRKLIELLDPFVRDEKDQEAKSRHILPMVGGITSELKNNWGLHNTWKKLLSPRFKRMNEISKTNDYFNINDNRIDLSGYENELKRLDHRHHAVDALVIACTSIDHVNYKNSLRSEHRRYDLEKKLFDINDKSNKKSYKKPWPTFVNDAEVALSNIIVSFKNRIRVITKTNNYYQKYIEQPDGSWNKGYVKQVSNINHVAIRKPLHQETIYGKRTLKEYTEVSLNKALENPTMIANKEIRNKVIKIYVKLDKDIKKLKKYFKNNPIELDGEIIQRLKISIFSNYASSKLLIDEKVNEKQLLKVVDQQLRKDLLQHLEKHGGNSSEAFSGNGLIEFNKNRHKPIYKATQKQDLGIAFPLSDQEPKNKKYGKGAKGSNLYFLIYKENATQKHIITSQSTIPFNDLIEIKKHKLEMAEFKEGHTYFTLSPGDLVYVFHEDEEKTLPDTIDPSRIYKCVSFSKSDCFFISQYVAAPIVNKKEFTVLNKMERSTDGIMIKKNCIKLEIDRLGSVIGFV
ncbi:MAG: HNH endonuclease domain-containing protein [Saprospiraceae bacterium]|nr:HNH endonuclease domain-containing protein [Saprospiraceae bacterium]